MSKIRLGIGLPKPVEASELMTLKEAASYLRIHPVTLYRMVKGRVVQGKAIPGFKIGSHWRFAKTVVDEWMKEVEVNRK